MSVSISQKVGRSVTNPSLHIPNLRNDVLAVQRLLNGAHTKRHVPHIQLAVDGIVGPKTAGAIAEFQQSMFGWKDGVVDPGGQTLRKLNEISGGAVGGGGGAGGGATSRWAEEAVKAALSQDGVREQPLGSNGGPRVMEYLNSVGLTHPDLWCMAFVYWSFQRGAGAAGVSNTLRRTASCTDLYSWARSHSKLVTSPHRGDIFLVRGGSNGRTHQHTGIIVDAQGGSLSTIEGNTNNDGSSNGIGVFRRTRHTTNLDFVRV